MTPNQTKAPLVHPDVAHASWLTPGRVLVLTFAATAVVCVVAAWAGWNATVTTRRAAEQEQLAERLSSRVVQYDEVLTMSAMMAAETGDAKWEDRYRRHEPKLSQTIDQIVAVAADSNTALAAAQLGKANDALVVIENRAFAAVRAGDRDTARQMLNAAEYQQLKQTYSAEIEGLIATARQRIDERIDALTARSGLLALCAMGLIIGLVIPWTMCARLIVGYERDRRDVSLRLLRLNRDLEEQVEARTAELFKAQKAKHPDRHAQTAESEANLVAAA